MEDLESHRIAYADPKGDYRCSWTVLLGVRWSEKDVGDIPGLVFPLSVSPSLGQIFQEKQSF